MLLTTVAAPAPVRFTRSPSSIASRWPRSPRTKSYSRLTGCAATRPSASIAVCASSARPRFVCRMVPVAFTTRQNFDAPSVSILPATRARIDSSSSASEPCERPCRMALRSSSRISRHPLTTYGRLNRESSASLAAWFSSQSTDGSSRRRSSGRLTFSRLAQRDEEFKTGRDGQEGLECVPTQRAPRGARRRALATRDGSAPGGVAPLAARWRPPAGKLVLKRCQSLARSLEKSTAPAQMEKEGVRWRRWSSKPVWRS